MFTAGPTAFLPVGFNGTVFARQVLVDQEDRCFVNRIGYPGYWENQPQLAFVNLGGPFSFTPREENGWLGEEKGTKEQVPHGFHRKASLQHCAVPSIGPLNDHPVGESGHRRTTVRLDPPAYIDPCPKRGDVSSGCLGFLWVPITVAIL